MKHILSLINLSNAVMWNIYFYYPSGKASIKTVCKGEAKQGGNNISYIYISGPIRIQPYLFSRSHKGNLTGYGIHRHFKTN